MYHLGDFSFATWSNTEEILKLLHGKINLIYGNHDKLLRKDTAGKYFHSRQDYLIPKIDGVKVAMFHYPILEWGSMHHGAFHLFGHVHSSYATIGGRSMNVGIDARPTGDMCPWHWEEVKEFMKDKEILEHH